jgi:hydrogenase nickel incorporation protein HypB
MCATCGCSPDAATIHEVHQHDHQHGHTHHHHEGKKIVEVEQDILHHNNLLAQRNRGYFLAKHILALNLVSSPGSGKTTLLEKTSRSQR